MNQLTSLVFFIISCFIVIADARHTRDKLYAAKVDKDRLIFRNTSSENINNSSNDIADESVDYFDWLTDGISFLLSSDSDSEDLEIDYDSVETSSSDNDDENSSSEDNSNRSTLNIFSYIRRLIKERQIKRNQNKLKV